MADRGRPSSKAQRYTLARSEQFSRPMTGHTPQKLPRFRAISCIIALRFCRLIADDAVEIKKVSSKTLVGNAPDLIRYFIELRGIGIVDVRRLFGMGAVKDTEKIDLVINLEHWDPEKMYDRFGLDEQYENILGINIPSITIPVHPGRNLAVVLEIAAMNHRQKKMGYNTAEEFNKRLMEQEF